MGFYHLRPSRNTNNKQWRPFFSVSEGGSELYSRNRAIPPSVRWSRPSKTCFELNPRNTPPSVHPTDTKMLPFRGLPRHFLPIFQEWLAVFVVAREVAFLALSYPAIVLSLVA